MELTIYFRINDDDKQQYAGKILLKENEKTEEAIRDRGREMIETAIRTLRINKI